jgi:hypothetical protein
MKGNKDVGHFPMAQKVVYSWLTEPVRVALRNTAFGRLLFTEPHLIESRYQKVLGRVGHGWGQTYTGRGILVEV